MRRVLLDENLPRKLRRELPEFAIRTTQEEGWTSFANGELLTRAQASFDVLLTADRRLRFQQNLAQFNIGIVIIVTQDIRYQKIRTAIDSVRSALTEVNPREFVEVRII